jgi:hypothetical protein
VLFTITPCVTEKLIKFLKTQLTPKAITNQAIKVWNQNSIEKIENSNCWNHCPDGAFQDFWNFIEVNFGFDPKTPFHHHDLFYHHANIQKFLMLQIICFGDQNTAKCYQISRLSRFPEIA